MVYNALAAAAVGNIYGLTTEQIKAGIESLEPVSYTHLDVYKRQAKGLALDMSRGKPSADQLDLSMGLMNVLSSDSDPVSYTHLVYAD